MLVCTDALIKLNFQRNFVESVWADHLYVFGEAKPMSFSGKLQSGKQQLPASGKIILLARETR